MAMTVYLLLVRLPCHLQGPNGVNYYSSWQFVINPDYTRITEGLNRITAKLSCPSNNNNTNEPLVDTHMKCHNQKYESLHSKQNTTYEEPQIILRLVNICCWLFFLNCILSMGHLQYIGFIPARYNVQNSLWIY
jgi:hypothetical protein